MVLVHEDGLFGSGLAKLMQAELPKRGFEILDTIAHPTPARDMSNVALQIRAKNPDLVIPSSYYGEFVLLARTMQQQKIKPKGIYCVLNGAASNYRFVKEFPEAAQNVMDCNHWYDPRNAGGAGPEEAGRGVRQVLHLQRRAELFRRAAAGRCDRARRLRRPQGDHRGAGVLDLRRPHHALRPDASSSTARTPAPRRSTPRCRAATSR